MSGAGAGAGAGAGGAEPGWAHSAGRHPVDDAHAAWDLGSRPRQRQHGVAWDGWRGVHGPTHARAPRDTASSVSRIPPAPCAAQDLVRGALPLLMSEDGWGVVLLVMSAALSRGVANVRVSAGGRERRAGAGRGGAERGGAGRGGGGGAGRDGGRSCRQQRAQWQARLRPLLGSSA